MGMDEFMAYAIKYKLVTGNTYVFAPRLTGGRFTEMWVMPAQYVKIVSGGWMNPVRGYIVENGSARKEFKSEEILHVKEVNLEAMNGEQLYGMSRLTPGRYTVDTNTMAQEASAHRFKNRGASALMTIKQAGQTGVSGPTPKAVNDLKRQIQAQMSGARKEGAIVATNMEAQIHKLDISAVDLGIFEGQRMTLHQICNLFHVPAILMDPTTGNTYNNIREAQKDFYRNAVLPELQLFLSAFNRFIGGAFKGEYLDYDTSNIEALQDDYGSMMTWLVNAPLTLNEKRKILGFEELPIPEANEIYIPSNWIPLELGGEMPKGVNNNTF
jgi:HK97 family phage portal protein